MIFTAWTNGNSGFGFKVSVEDRDNFFDRNWTEVIVELPKGNEYKDVSCNISKTSFWNKCHDLVSKEIKSWLEENHYIPWERGNPPKFEVQQHDENHFKIIR